MSQGIAAEQLYSAIEEAARIVGAPFSRDKVWPILDAYRDALTSGTIVLSAQIEGGRVIEVEYTVQVTPGQHGPYARALANGLLPRTDHPVGSVLSELGARVPIDDHLIDAGIAGGFKKIYAQFPRNLQKLADLADMPSMPPAVAGNADLFARHGLDEVALVGVNYQRKSVNLYFQLPSDVAGNIDPKTILSLLRETGMPEPDEPALAYASRSYRVYTTLGWDSPEIQRLSFAPMPSPGLDPSALPARPNPELVQFLRNTPYTYDGERINAAAVKWSSGGVQLDLGVYYQIPPLLLKVFTSHAESA
jgi:Aromatic prenyltransferase Orf2